MKIIHLSRFPLTKGNSRKMLRIMKLTIVIITAFLLQVSASSRAQLITLRTENISLKRALLEVRKQSGFTVLYKSEDINKTKAINLNLVNVSLDEALTKILKSNGLEFSIEDKAILITKARLSIIERISSFLKKDSTIYTGTILDENGKPLSGVTIRLKGSNIAVRSLANGLFAYYTSNKGILVFSYIGYADQEISLNKLDPSNPITVQMKVSYSTLDQVQITAYGRTTKRLNTGNITSIKSEQLMLNPVPNILQAVQGHVPGVFIQQMSGRPGSPISLNVRGQNTIVGNNQPLFIVDGVPYPNGNLPILNNGLNQILRGGSALDYLDMSQVESIDFLKDADATSIYGSRGAYGVVLITTKKGKAGVNQLNVNINTGITTKGVSQRLLNTEEYLQIRREAFANDKMNPGPNDLDLNGTWPTNRYTNWVDEFSGNTAEMTTANASYSGGNENVRFLIGANYNKQNDIQSAKGSNRRGGLNFNLNTNSKDNKFFLNFSGSYSSTVNDAIPYDFASSTNTFSAPNAPPLYLANGSLNWELGDNPAKVFEVITKNTTNNLIANGEIKYEPIKGLTLRTNIGFNMLSSKQLNALPSQYFNPSTAYTTESTIQFYNNRTWTVEPNINYTFQLGAKGHLSTTLGATLQDGLNYDNSIKGNSFLSDDLLYNPSFAPSANVGASYNQTPNRYLGFFGIVNYNWANKYIINIGTRYDGSTKFGSENQMGFFGSVGAAWIMSEEKWFKDNIAEGFISNAKIRGSYGTVGGDGIANYLYLATFVNGSQYQGGVGLKPDALANPDLQWEKNQKGEIALSLEFLKGRINIEGSYYKNRTSNQLVPLPLSSVTGFQSISINSPAILKNWGYEFEMNTVNIQTKNFRWTSLFNFTIPRSVLAAYPNNQTLTNVNFEVGQPITSIKLFNYAGVNPQTGNYNFVKNGVTGEWLPFISVGLDNIKDKTERIDLAPKFFGGLQNSFTYKNFSLSAFITFTKRKGKNIFGSQFGSIGSFNYNPSIIALDRWQKPGDITNVPRPVQQSFTLFQQQNFVNSTGAYSDATYARLSNMNLSYNFSSEMLKKIHITRLAVFLQGQNLLTVSKYKNLDPENLGAGQAPLRVFTAGLNLTL
jgi:TonB-linked SusC/RagA family outer membrane protein